MRVKVVAVVTFEHRTDEAGRAIAALRAVALDHGTLHGMQVRRTAHAFHAYDLAPRKQAHRHETTCPLPDKSVCHLRRARQWPPSTRRNRLRHNLPSSRSGRCPAKSHRRRARTKRAGAAPGRPVSSGKSVPTPAISCTSCRMRSIGTISAARPSSGPTTTRLPPSAPPSSRTAARVMPSWRAASSMHSWTTSPSSRRMMSARPSLAVLYFIVDLRSLPHPTRGCALRTPPQHRCGDQAPPPAAGCGARRTR